MGQLKDAIIRQVLGLGPRQNPTEDVVMYRVDQTSDDLDSLLQQSTFPRISERLRGGTRPVLDVWKGGPSENHVHIFVDYPPRSMLFSRIQLDDRF